jgi:hypothetical protein
MCAYVSTLIGTHQTQQQLMRALLCAVWCVLVIAIMAKTVGVVVLCISGTGGMSPYAQNVCNALDGVCHFTNTNIYKNDFNGKGDQQFVDFGALRGCVVAVRRFQVSGSRPCSFANMMRPPLFLHHAQLCTNPQHGSLVSPPPAHQASNTPASALWHSSSPISAVRLRPLT